MSKGTISFFVSDLAGNAIVRAAPLALALRADGWDIEIVGLLVSGDQVYAPYRGLFEYRTVRSTGHLRHHLGELAKLARGDIVYACKPSVQSFLPALINSRFGLRKPLLLDAEDDELWIDEAITGTGLAGWLRRRWSLKYNYALHPFVAFAAGISVVSRTLQKRYGGKIVLHGPDSTVFDPSRPELQRSVCRRRWVLPVDKPVVLFAGMPQKHKGLDVLVESLMKPCNSSVHLALAGPETHIDFQCAASKLGERAHLLGLVANSDITA